MRKLVYIVLAGIMIMASCKKETGPVLLDNPTAPVLTAPSANAQLVLLEADAADIVTFTWTAADYGFQAGVTYTLQYDKAGNGFENPVALATTNDLTVDIPVETLNGAMLGAELPDGVVTNIELRVRATVSEFVDNIYSSVVTVGINPYLVKVVYPQLQVPGNYQGWDPSNDNTVIFSKLSDDKYEGYIYFTEAATEFKYTVGHDWGVNYGDDGNDGTLDKNGANIPAAGPALYKLNVDLVKLTHSYTMTDWGLIGSATPGGWDTDTNMTLDVATRILSITIDLVVGDIKFRANDAWAINLGDNGANGSCEYDGANIAIAEAGNYTITLDLSQAVYKYKIKKN